MRLCGWLMICWFRRKHVAKIRFRKRRKWLRNEMIWRISDWSWRSRINSRCKKTKLWWRNCRRRSRFSRSKNLVRTKRNCTRKRRRNTIRNWRNFQSRTSKQLCSRVRWRTSLPLLKSRSTSWDCSSCTRASVPRVRRRKTTIFDTTISAMSRDRFSPSLISWRHSRRITKSTRRARVEERNSSVISRKPTKDSKRITRRR